MHITFHAARIAAHCITNDLCVSATDRQLRRINKRARRLGTPMGDTRDRADVIVV